MNPWLGRGLSLAVGVVLGWLAGRKADLFGGDEYASDASEDPVPRPRRRPGAAAPSSREELKMVLVVNGELRMGKGKIGAQCAHAAVGAVERLHERSQTAALQQWEMHGQPKICLLAPSTQALRELASQAAARSLPTFVVQDAGRTQVAAGSRTVLAIGPATKSAIDQVTGHLKLL
ncbi:hypothetical protein D9Q98_006315 [Chlorella vulgaris]|uniref:peptidyl-tRNA hydrolase n=1 Tax=Chlorella vulgaris TaxID=3077 RepID=A0A9D4TK27_CHLVU|nr:hypothetical protein D9Q98_006315 [Chlorella vulgaris]